MSDGDKMVGRRTLPSWLVPAGCFLLHREESGDGKAEPILMGRHPLDGGGAGSQSDEFDLLLLAVSQISSQKNSSQRLAAVRWIGFLLKLPRGAATTSAILSRTSNDKSMKLGGSGRRRRVPAGKPGGEKEVEEDSQGRFCPIHSEYMKNTAKSARPNTSFQRTAKTPVIGKHQLPMARYSYFCSGRTGPPTMHTGYLTGGDMIRKQEPMAYLDHGKISSAKIDDQNLRDMMIAYAEIN
ncbi:hypothetical protein EJB05_40365 [Eragrostis curvula]|uniref:Uncharacterized protein n=1 Tax=Eragrostis curvula TaxID=38414 RepID=A0A5J9TPZ2_9POAL|nr:hypothetical protein EJB05_40365 [Eragrostis curvula]